MLRREAVGVLLGRTAGSGHGRGTDGEDSPAGEGRDVADTSGGGA